jgi:hypothetical protein
MTAASWLPPHPQRAGIGEPLRRLEDARPLTGRGCYSDDLIWQAKSTQWWYDRLTRMRG